MAENSRGQQTTEAINNLIFDTLVTVDRARALAESVRSDGEFQTQAHELDAFADELAAAASQLRRDGLHPSDQGRLL